MYKVIKHFVDLMDRSHEYHTGDVFPRSGLTVSDERLKELSTNANKRNIPLIAEVDDEKKSAPDKAKKSGGGRKKKENVD